MLEPVKRSNYRQASSAGALAISAYKYNRNGFRTPTALVNEYVEKTAPILLQSCFLYHFHYKILTEQPVDNGMYERMWKAFYIPNAMVDVYSSGIESPRM